MIISSFHRNRKAVKTIALSLPNPLNNVKLTALGVSGSRRQQCNRLDDLSACGCNRSVLYLSGEVKDEDVLGLGDADDLFFQLIDQYGGHCTLVTYRGWMITVPHFQTPKTKLMMIGVTVMLLLK